MAQYVDIMTDAGFKAVFQDKQVTIKFLNAAPVSYTHLTLPTTPYV